MRNIDKSFENSLVKLVNKRYLNEDDVYIEKYQRVDMYIYNLEILKNILSKCKFKDIGNVYEYPDDLPQPESISTMELKADFNLFQRIAISKKYNSIVFYSTDTYSINCTFLIDVDHLKKFSKKTKEILNHDSGSNLFRDTDFNCEDKEYIEISETMEQRTKPIDAIKKKVADENLVFDKDSAINQVMNDINTFFTEDAKKLYERLELPYKRGIIIYGDPGNGKSAMLREIIRIVPKITKVLINPNVNNITRILHSLTKALNGRQAIIIIEDIDSLITDRNRSEFLNILDGIDIKSGLYFIGTTNYPEQIDPAFMNRSGRFDRTYKIDIPTASMRKIYFESRKVGKLLSYYKVFKDDSIPDSDEGIIDLFIKNSENLPMASLKELITSTCYMLAANPEMTVEEAVTTCYQTLIKVRNEHLNSHHAFNKFRNRRPSIINDSYDDEDDEYVD